MMPRWGWSWGHIAPSVAPGLIRFTRIPRGASSMAALRGKEAHAVGRLFRILGLLHPGERFSAIHRGLSSRSAEIRSSSLELVENVLEPPVRGAVLGLVDSIPDDARRAQGRAYHAPARRDRAPGAPARRHDRQ